MTTFGWKAGPEPFPPIELLEQAVAAEQAGFDSINVSDHFHPWSEEGQAPFTWTWLGAAAVQTRKIGLGTGLTCPILRYHPAIIAQAAATVACMAPRRAFLCVGTGEALNEYAAVGAWPEYETRQAMLREAIELMRLLWTGEEVTFDGDFYHTRKARLYTVPKETIPLYISTLVPASAHFAGEFGDGLITTGGEDPAHYQEWLQEFENGARQGGKDPAEMPRLIEVNVAYTDDLEGAVQSVKKYWAGTFIPALFSQRIYTPKMSAENGKAVGAEAIRKGGCFSADPDEHVDFAQNFVDLGFDQLYFHYAGMDQKEFLKRYGQDVLPKLRERNGEKQPSMKARA